MIKNFIKKFIPYFLLDWYHYFLALIGAVFYRFPSRLRRPASPKLQRGEGFGGQAKKLTVIGVTGTKGKSTVVELTARILEEAGFKVASLSSIKFKIGDREWPNLLKMTMPGRWKLQKFLREAVDSGCQYAILEVTSEGIKQHRHRFIDFDVAVFTNLAPEHIEAHGSFENYKRAKGELFKALKLKTQNSKVKSTNRNSKVKKISIVNLDDPHAEYFLKFPADQKIGYTRQNIDRDFDRDSISIIRASNCREAKEGIKFSVKDANFALKFLGQFNIYNALAAICIGLSQGIDLETCKKALEKVEVLPGRMEVVIRKPFTVIVDYAHTPDALEKVYQTLTSNIEHRTSNKLICVLGSAGGGRDKWKRPVLGEIAAKYCDQIIITNEDPYDENPLEIIDQIGKGISVNQRKSTSIYKILDRREAIKKALTLAQPNDVVIITGKGCEPWMCVAKGKKIPWDDREIVREELQKLNL